MMAAAGNATRDIARIQGAFDSRDTIDSFFLNRYTSTLIMLAIVFFLGVCVWAIVVAPSI